MKIYVKRRGRIVGRKRRGYYDIYRIKRNGEGWYLEHIVINGQCNKKGEPYLFKNLEQDFINYPQSLGDYMEFLWEHSRGKSDTWIQQKLNVIAKWISDVERTSPESEFWRSLK